jgi:hypothetical protein
MDLFRNPIGSLTSLAFFRAKALQKCFLYGNFSETEVSEKPTDYQVSENPKIPRILFCDHSFAENQFLFNSTK